MGLSKHDGNKILVEEGWFNGLHKILTNYNVSTETAVRMKVGLFGLIHGKVQESVSEIAKLQAVAARMEAACRAGMVPKPSEAQNAFSNDVMKLKREMRAFDGWTISLLETDISLLAAVDNPETAGQRVEGLKRSFADLWNRRITDGFKMMASHPDLFNVTLFVK